MLNLHHIDYFSQLLCNIDEWFEEAEEDIDIVWQDEVLHITLPSNQQIVISRQQALKEIWIASPWGAYHFHMSAQGWINTQGDLLSECLTQLIQKAGLSLLKPFPPQPGIF